MYFLYIFKCIYVIAINESENFYTRRCQLTAAGAILQFSSHHWIQSSYNSVKLLKSKTRTELPIFETLDSRFTLRPK